MKIHLVFFVDEKKYTPGNEHHIKQMFSSTLAGKGVVSAESARKRYEKELSREDIPDYLKEKHLQAIAQLNECAVIYDKLWIEDD